MTDQHEFTEKRRRDDPRIAQLLADQTHLHLCVEGLKEDVTTLKNELKRNTEVTEDVRDILGSFRVVAAVAKWGGAIAGGAAGIIAAVKAWK